MVEVNTDASKGRRYGHVTVGDNPRWLETCSCYLLSVKDQRSLKRLTWDL